MNYSNKLKQYSLVLFAAMFMGIFTACDNSTSAMEELDERTVQYAFNEGQLLGSVDTAYRGDHERNLSASIMIEELPNGNASVTVMLTNTISGVTYPVHAHDAADPSTTPNGTPYNETPNGNVFAGGIQGNGGTAMATSESSVPFAELVNTYEGFFVVHDPTQDISTTDLTTYLILGVFGQSLDAGTPELRSETFMYDFNEGQLLDNPDTAYDGPHARNLTASVLIEERFNGLATITVTLNNTIDGEVYPVHSHDAADPSTTPNGTPYNETPNHDFAGIVNGNGGSANFSTDTMNLRYLQLLNEYEGFFVVHDPLQDISTTDLTTYLILGLTAR